MAQRKPSFRFRIPSWLSGTPESMSRRPKDSSKSTARSNTSVPIQRPSRPSLITPAELPPIPAKTQENTRIEPLNQSPPRPTQPTPLSTSVIVETTHSKPSSPSISSNHVNSPPSPSHAASQVHVVSTQPQSPFRYDTMKEPEPKPKPSPTEENTHPTSFASEQEKEKMVNKSEPMQHEAKSESELKMNSPLIEITKSPQHVGSEQQASFMPSSPQVSKVEPASEHHPPSPLASVQNEELKANHEENTFYTSSTSQEQKEKIPVSLSEPLPNEAERKINSPSKIIPVSQPENLSKHTKTNLDEERSISKSPPPKPPLETQRKFLQHKEKENVMHESKKVGKAKEKSISHTSQPKRHTKASSSGTKDKKQHGVKETVERKIMFATSNSSGKDIGVLSSKDPSSSISNQRNAPSSDEREKRNEKEKGPIQKGIKDDITKFVHKISASLQPTQPMEDKKFSVITLTGDNRGATMHVGSESDKKEGSIHIHRAYKNESEESIEVTTDGEGNTNNDEGNSMEHSEVGKAYVNSNIQSINNSLMFHGSINERDPGVQVTVPQKPSEIINRDEDTNNHRTEFNISRSRKSTFQPTVRRYGCKFSSSNNNEDIEIM
ncbi:PH domain-containing protein DDB_G0287875-like [Trifolium pratense]|uniref:PH domain-containing protein DDB_G0287875-like n=1 Tax=Trifolium pratense TaxID=57577 RepID=UPI001E68FE22|nr:PH domain-containing protein DDB_G0287875-like [Trifolium pratense]